MKQMSISLQLMDPSFKPVHEVIYTVPRSVEQQLKHSKEIVRLVGIGVLEEEYSSEWALLFPTFAIPKNNAEATIQVDTDFRNLKLLLKHEMLPIPYSEDRGYDPFNGRDFLLPQHWTKIWVIITST
jgi:hypothetical protein